MKSSSHKTSEMLLLLVTGVCLAAGAAFAGENSTTGGAHKSTQHLAASHSTTTHPTPKKAKVPASHSAAQHRAQSNSNAARHTAGKTTSHTYSAAAPVKGTPARAASQRKGSGHNRSAKPGRKRTSSGQQRLARLHLAPERVQEIQHALTSQGYMEGAATGEWDAPTRGAMLKYQASHGFPPTGLPEAKSLMKLGLGPHPLAPELDRGQVSTANAGVTATVQNVFTRTPNTPPDSPSLPASLGTIVPEAK